nr:MAG TPA: hypothetical protein [Caudoviricetes sp.]
MDAVAGARTISAEGGLYRPGVADDYERGR